MILVAFKKQIVIIFLVCFNVQIQTLQFTYISLNFSLHRNEAHVDTRTVNMANHVYNLEFPYQ